MTKYRVIYQPMVMILYL